MFKALSSLAPRGRRPADRRMPPTGSRRDDAGPGSHLRTRNLHLKPQRKLFSSGNLFPLFQLCKYHVLTGVTSSVDGFEMVSTRTFVSMFPFYCGDIYRQAVATSGPRCHSLTALSSPWFGRKSAVFLSGEMNIEVATIKQRGGQHQGHLRKEPSESEYSDEVKATAPALLYQHGALQL